MASQAADQRQGVRGRRSQPKSEADFLRQSCSCPLTKDVLHFLAGMKAAGDQIVFALPFEFLDLQCTFPCTSCIACIHRNTNILIPFSECGVQATMVDLVISAAADGQL